MKSPSRPAGLRPTPIALVIHALLLGTPAAAALAAATWAPPALAQTDESSKRFDIPTGSLEDALNTLARQAGITLSFDPAFVAGKSAAALRGTMAAGAALERLLAGSGIMASASRPGVYTLKPMPAASAAPKTLPAVEVTDGADTGSAARGYRSRQATVAGFTEQPLQDTPFSVKVLPAELLANHKVETIGALDRLDASVTAAATNPGFFSQLSIRGLSLDTWSNYRYNGLMLVNQEATGLENKERVEILKGLSALQTGFAAPGGLINYVTKRPAGDAVNDLHLSANEYGNAKVHADLSRRSEDQRFGLRVNAAWEDERSHVRKVDGERQFLALAADWRLTPDTLLQIDIEHERRDQVAQPDLEADLNGRLPRDVDPRRFLGQTWASYPTEFTLLGAKLEHALDEHWSLVAEANWMRLDRDQNAIYLLDIQPDGDAEAFLYYSPDQRREPVNARLAAKGRFDTGAVSHELAFGLTSHYHKAYWGDGFWGSIGSTNIHNPVKLANPDPAVDDSYLATKTVEHGIFVNDILSFGEAWKLHLGGRHARRNQRWYDSSGAVSGEPYEKEVFSPSAALVFKPHAKVSTYLSYVEGLEQGGTAPLGTTNQDKQLAPRTSEQIEAGVKAELGDGLDAEAALFRIDRPAEYVDAANTYVQDGLQRHQGVELSLTGKLAHEWTVFGSAMLLDAELKKTGNAATEGKRPVNVPKERLALVVEYAPQALEGWVFGATWTHTGSRPLNASNTGESAPGYAVFGLGARWSTRFGATPATLRVNVDNLFDESYWANAQNGSLVAGAPRTVSASMSVRF